MVVLGVISLFSVLSAMLITTSKVAGISSKVNVDRSVAKYHTESATSFVQWMVMNYNFNYPSRDELGIDDVEEESWWADGRDHTLEMADGFMAKVKIFDVNRGWNIDRLNSEKNRIINQRAGDDEEMQDNIEEFFAVYQDYVDGDDLLRHPTFGMEKDDYERIGLEDFPRNRKVQFREEMYWIKNVKYLAPDLERMESSTALPDTLFRVPPPLNISDPIRNKRYTFWSAPMHWLQTNLPGGLSSSDRQTITECRSEGFVDQPTIEECLGLDLASRLRSLVTFNPRDTVVFTLDAIVTSPNGEISRRQVSTLNLRNLPAQRGDSDVGRVVTLPYWQKVYY